MRMIDEIAHRSAHLGNIVTDFYLVQSSSGGTARYKVVETGTPTKIYGGEVQTYRFDYVVYVFHAAGWVEVLRVNEDHAADSIHAAQIAHRIVTEKES